VKNCEEAIDKVLAGLGAAEPAAGMNQRITAGLHYRSSALARTGAGRVRFAWISAPVAAALVVSVLIFQAVHHQSPIRTEPTQRDGKEATATSQPLVRTETFPSFTHVTPPARTVGLASKHGAKASTGAEDMDALAIEEMRAASQPAPPLPLNDQEKLLLRMTHKKTPIELAALSPSVRARHDSEEEADFQKFFEPPKPPADQE
jgi:hypothetical protein